MNLSRSTLNKEKRGLEPDFCLFMSNLAGRKHTLIKLNFPIFSLSSQTIKRQGFQSQTSLVMIFKGVEFSRDALTYPYLYPPTTRLPRNNFDQTNVVCRYIPTNVKIKPMPFALAWTWPILILKKVFLLNKNSNLDVFQRWNECRDLNLLKAMISERLLALLFTNLIGYIINNW